MNTKGESSHRPYNLRSINYWKLAKDGLSKKQLFGKSWEFLAYFYRILWNEISSFPGFNFVLSQNSNFQPPWKKSTVLSIYAPVLIRPEYSKFTFQGYISTPSRKKKLEQFEISTICPDFGSEIRQLRLWVCRILMRWS